MAPVGPRRQVLHRHRVLGHPVGLAVGARRGGLEHLALAGVVGVPDVEDDVGVEALAGLVAGLELLHVGEADELPVGGVVVPVAVVELAGRLPAQAVGLGDPREHLHGHRYRGAPGAPVDHVGGLEVARRGVAQGDVAAHPVVHVVEEVRPRPPSEAHVHQAIGGVRRRGRGVDDIGAPVPVDVHEAHGGGAGIAVGRPGDADVGAEAAVALEPDVEVVDAHVDHVHQAVAVDVGEAQVGRRVGDGGRAREHHLGAVVPVAEVGVVGDGAAAHHAHVHQPVAVEVGEAHVGTGEVEVGVRRLGGHRRVPASVSPVAPPVPARRGALHQVGEPVAVEVVGAHVGLAQGRRRGVGERHRGAPAPPEVRQVRRAPAGLPEDVHPPVAVEVRHRHRGAGQGVRGAVRDVDLGGEGRPLVAPPPVGTGLELDDVGERVPVDVEDGGVGVREAHRGCVGHVRDLYLAGVEGGVVERERGEAGAVGGLEGHRRQARDRRRVVVGQGVGPQVGAVRLDPDAREAPRGDDLVAGAVVGAHVGARAVVEEDVVVGGAGGHVVLDLGEVGLALVLGPGEGDALAGGGDDLLELPGEDPGGSGLPGGGGDPEAHHRAVLLVDLPVVGGVAEAQEAALGLEAVDPAAQGDQRRAVVGEGVGGVVVAGDALGGAAADDMGAREVPADAHDAVAAAGVVAECQARGDAGGAPGELELDPVGARAGVEVGLEGTPEPAHRARPGGQGEGRGADPGLRRGGGQGRVAQGEGGEDHARQDPTASCRMNRAPSHPVTDPLVHRVSPGGPAAAAWV